MKLFHKVYGESGEALFILHGIFGMLDNWHNIARKLSETYKVITIDARNHGQSPHSSEMSYDLMADDVIELADDLGIQKFILMGHSMGGKTAMNCAVRYPERVSKLIVVDIAPKAYKPGHATYFNAFENINWAALNNRKEVDEALSRYEEDAGVRLFLAKNIERAETGGFLVKSNMKAIREAYQGIIGDFTLNGVYTGPVQFITGSRSSYLKEEDKPSIESHFKNVQYSVVEGAGHWVHADKPLEFISALSAFLVSY